MTDLKIVDEEKACYIKDKPIYLTNNEYRLLKYLMQRPNYIFSRKEILDDLWKDKNVTPKAVDMTIKRLREKLDKYSKCISSRSGYGYSFKMCA